MKSTVLSNHFFDVLPARLAAADIDDLGLGLDDQDGHLNHELDVFELDLVPLKYELERVSDFSLAPKGHQDVDS